MNTTSGSVRPAAVADMFYPGHAQKLQSMVRLMLEEAGKTVPPDAPAPKAVIAPHAGYVYSGPIAASAFARLTKAKGQIRRVVLLGPSHRVAFYGLAAPSARAFETPLGPVELDRTTIEQLLARKELGVVELDEAHSIEHSLEVELPFLIEALSSFTLVPLAVGRVGPEQIARVLETLWGGPETLIVISSDLSHYLDYLSAQSVDRATSQAIERLDAVDLEPHQACGVLAIQGLLLAAKNHQLQAQTVDLRNSGDTGGQAHREQVVGYGAFVFA